MYNSAGMSRGTSVLDQEMSSEQVLLRDATAHFIEEVCPLPVLRGHAESPTPMPADYLRRGAELGWFAMLVPERYGGGNISGDGVVDAALLAEARGARVQPGPFVPMNIVADALACHGNEYQREHVLPTLVSGEQVATWALSDPALALAGRGGVTATANARGYQLNGVKPFVQDPESAHWILLDVVADGSLRQVLLDAHAPGVSVKLCESVDFSVRMGRLELDGAQIDDADFVGAATASQAALSGQVDLAAALSVAETVGAMKTLFEMTVQYAGDRVAFGRPIGSYQAVKHQLADLSLQLEMSTAAAYAAVRAVSGDRESPTGADQGAVVASVAKAFVGDAAVQIAQGCFQVFGGIGFTWEHDLHLYLRRASLNAVLYGTPTWHRDRIVELGIR